MPVDAPSHPSTPDFREAGESDCNDDDGDDISRTSSRVKRLLYTYVSVTSTGGKEFVKTILPMISGMCKEYTFKVTQERETIREEIMEKTYNFSGAECFSVVAECVIMMLNTYHKNDVILRKLHEELNSLEGVEIGEFATCECDIPLLKPVGLIDIEDDGGEEKLFETFIDNGVALVDDALPHKVVTSPLINAIEKITPIKSGFDLDLTNEQSLKDFKDYATIETHDGLSVCNLVEKIIGQDCELRKIGATDSFPTAWSSLAGDDNDFISTREIVRVLIPLSSSHVEATGREGSLQFWGGTQNVEYFLRDHKVGNSIESDTFTVGACKVGECILVDSKTFLRFFKGSSISINDNNNNNNDDNNDNNKKKTDWGVSPQTYLYVDYYSARSKASLSIGSNGRKHGSSAIGQNRAVYFEDDDNEKKLVSNKQKFEIRKNPRSGRCMFATAPIKYGELIHTAPGLIFTRENYEIHGKHTPLSEYVFNLPNGDKMLAFGYGSMFNHHAKRPNVDFRLDREETVIRYFAGKDIAKGEELFIYYGSKLWFEDDYEDTKEVDSSSSGDDEDGGNFLARMKV